MNIFSAGDGNSLINTPAKKVRSYQYKEVPVVSIAAFTSIANGAYRAEKFEYFSEAIRMFKDLHNYSLMSWVKPGVLPPKQRYEIRMTMKIIRMELESLRQKSLKTPS
jgi:hypothetical protein